MSISELYSSHLQRLREEQRLRQILTLADLADGRVLVDGHSCVDFSSNSYLALHRHSLLRAAAARAAREHGTSAAASRLAGGARSYHARLEEATAAWKQWPRCLLLNSGFQANAALPAALAAAGGIQIFADRLVHASLIDGIRSSGAPFSRFAHNNLADLEAQLRRRKAPALVITESLFSMDGDSPDLQELVAIARRHEALLLIDDAHGAAWCGPQGRGLTHGLHHDYEQLIVMGTYSKALGSFGAYACTSPLLHEYLVNATRSFIFSTALPPAVCAASEAAVAFVQSSEADLLRAHLDSLILHLRSGLQTIGLSPLGGHTPICPVIVGTEERALALSLRLRERGLHVPAIRPPTVPAGSCRLRITLNASLSHADIDALLQALGEGA